MSKEKFALGDLVFAKVRGFSPWPARITGLGPMDRYNIFFYGTYQTATVKSKDIWHYTQETKEKFGSRKIKSKGYTEAIDQIENSPEIAPVEEENNDNGLISNTQHSEESLVFAKAPIKKRAEATKYAKIVENPMSASKSLSKLVKRTADDSKAKEVNPAKSAAEKNHGVRISDIRKSMKSQKEELISQASPTGSISEPRKMWAKVKNMDDMIELNLDQDRPDSFPSNESKIRWEMASARQALIFKKKVESGEFIPPEVKKSLLDKKENLSWEERAVLDREKVLEKKKNCQRWLKEVKRLNIAIKMALCLEKPAPKKCITALDELSVLYVNNFLLTKHPDIITTLR